MADTDELDGDESRVMLMTLHTAKGLEYPVVFLVGAEEGVFPHIRALTEPDELEEERRLAYVGITRARERLYLSHAWSRTLFGSTQYNPPSRFLDEIPAELVEAIGERAGRGGGRASYRERERWRRRDDDEAWADHRERVVEAALGPVSVRIRSRPERRRCRCASATTSATPPTARASSSTSWARATRPRPASASRTSARRPSSWPVYAPAEGLSLRPPRPTGRPPPALEHDGAGGDVAHDEEEERPIDGQRDGPGRGGLAAGTEATVVGGARSLPPSWSTARPASCWTVARNSGRSTDASGSTMALKSADARIEGRRHARGGEGVTRRDGGLDVPAWAASAGRCGVPGWPRPS